jgi:hypothetical protein
MLRVLMWMVVGIAALQGVFLAAHWCGDAWSFAVTIRNPEAYPHGGELLAPWTRQFFYAVGFLIVGAIISVAVRPRSWKRSLQPWLLGGALAFALACVGILAHPAFQVYSTGDDGHGHGYTSRLPRRNAVNFGVEAALLAYVWFELRRRSRSITAEDEP